MTLTHRLAAPSSSTPISAAEFRPSRFGLPSVHGGWPISALRAIAALAALSVSLFQALPATAQLGGNDPDADGIINLLDNCPNDSNVDQHDVDGDGVGDTCDLQCNPFLNTPQDPDCDGLDTAVDNCPSHRNPLQDDADSDGQGDVCDPTIRIATLLSGAGGGVLQALDGTIVPPGFFDPANFDPNGLIRVGVAIGVPPNKTVLDYAYRVASSETVPAGVLELNPFPVIQSTTAVDVGIAGSPPWFANPATPPNGWGQVRAGSYMANPLVPVAPLIAELIDVHTGDVVDIDRVTVIDGRLVEAESWGAVLDDPLVHQITPAGFDRLEITHTEPLPYPSLQALNDQLDVELDEINPTRTAPLSSSVCLPLNTFPEFAETSAYGAALTEAQIQFGSWKFLDEICSSPNSPPVLAFCASNLAAAVTCATACVAKDLICVQQIPRKQHFEVCIDGLEATLTDETVTELAAIDLSISSTQSDTIDSDVTFSGIGALADVRLDDFTINYVEGNLPCLPPRPSEVVTREDVDSVPELVDALICRDAQITAATACSTCDPDFPNLPFTTNPEPLGISIDAFNDERITVSDNGDNNLMLTGVGTAVPPNTVCSDQSLSLTLQNEAHNLLAEFYPDLITLLEGAWQTPLGGKGQDDLLDDLLIPFETGFSTFPGYDADLAFIDVETNPTHGLTLQQSFDFAAIVPTPPPPSQLYDHSIPLAITHDAGVTPGGTPYHIQQTITTRYLNRLLGIQSNVLFNLTAAPTYADLGIAPPQGLPPAAPFPMVGKELDDWFPLFAEIGDESVSIAITPIVTPFTWMPFDWATDQAPLQLLVPHLRLTITDGNGRVWLRMLVDHMGGDVNFSFSAIDGDPYLESTRGGANWVGLFEAIGFAGCPLEAVYDAIAPDPCGSALHNAVLSLFEEDLDAALDEIFGTIPAPQLFDQAATSALPFRTAPLAQHWSATGHYSVFADLTLADPTDTDGDGILDSIDNCIDQPNASQANNDDDDFGDACDLNDDNDLFLDTIDLCPFVPSGSLIGPGGPNQPDFDSDGVGDECDPDADGDGFPNLADNCPWVPNPLQVDGDQDGVGNVCDFDTDNDGVDDATDNCPSIPNSTQLDADGDGLGAACDDDEDGDGIVDTVDNCVGLPNGNQFDFDTDGIGNACDPDTDNDGIATTEDNCPNFPNPDQTDQNANGIGDACEGPNVDSDLDGTPDILDDFPLRAGGQTDTDGDGLPDTLTPGCGPGCQAAMGFTEDFDDDNDNLLDVVETGTGTFVSPTNTGSNPLVVDSDGDGVGDGDEVIAGTDPNIPNAPPAVPFLTWPAAAALLGLLQALGIRAMRTRRRVAEDISERACSKYRPA